MNRSDNTTFSDTTHTTTYTYDDGGRVLAQTQADATDPANPVILSKNLSQYDLYGTKIFSALDVNQNGVIDFNGRDRVTGYVSTYIVKDDALWQESTQTVYPDFDSDRTVTTSKSRRKLTGLGDFSSVSETEDIRGNVTTSTQAVDRNTGLTVSSTTVPTSIQPQVQIQNYGLLAKSISTSAITNEYAYDGLNRRIAVTDGRGNTSTMAYNTLGQVAYTEDGTTNRTSYVYDQYGRQIETIDALNQSTHTVYDLRGSVVKQYGATYPVWYEYDAEGRMVAMATTRDAALDPATVDTLDHPSLDVTRWNYDPATGLLTQKLYDDGKGPSYTYTPDGKLATRTWARGVVTTYSYTNTGEMIGIDYSDSTPDISFTYNRIGQQMTVDDAQGTLAFSYDPLTLALTNETIVAGGATSVIARVKDSLGRPGNLSFGSDYQVEYGYSGAGRFERVDSVVLGVTNNWQYSYLQDSDLISQFVESNAGVTNSRSYEANRNLIIEIHNQAQGSTISKYEYQNNAIGHRIQRIDTTTSVITNTFGYNARNELMNAIMGDLSFEWALDNIGNRETYTTNGMTFNYQVNNLNQYTNIVNRTTNDLTWDLDGNLLTDGKFINSWSGENRLIALEPLNPSNGSQRVELDYDYQGRRYKKVVATYNGSSWDITSTNLFCYDDWNPIAEIIKTSSGETTNYWTHGLDLSGSMHGAGGIGGMLTWSRSSDTNTFLYFADGNGNITELTDASDSTNVVARYQWSAYGDVISATGSEIDNNVFRWSSKYVIVETGDKDFGYRIMRDGRFTSRDPKKELGFKIGQDFKARIAFRIARNRLTVSIDKMALSARSGSMEAALAQSLRQLAARLRSVSYEQFAASSGNLYLFAGNNPINLIEFLGLEGQAPGDQWPPPDEFEGYEGDWGDLAKALWKWFEQKYKKEIDDLKKKAVEWAEENKKEACCIVGAGAACYLIGDYKINEKIEIPEIPIKINESMTLSVEGCKNCKDGEWKVEVKFKWEF